MSSKVNPDKVTLPKFSTVIVYSIVSPKPNSPSPLSLIDASINDNGDGELGLGDTIEYTITVENLGNVTLSGLTLEDTLTDGQDNTLTLTSGPSFESSTMNSLEGALHVELLLMSSLLNFQKRGLK